MNANRPYLVIPKLIEQPTWGGTYIVETKRWDSLPSISGKKIGQSYELYDKSNLSLIERSDDPVFAPELSDNKAVERQSVVAGSISLTSIIQNDPEAVLGKRVFHTYGAVMPLLLKFTQALGNSFQLHLPDGTSHPKWRTKPESWYYFEPGLITCGVKQGIDWDEYKNAVTKLDEKVQSFASMVRTGAKPYEQAKKEIDDLIAMYNPWQYVNLVRVEKGQLLDLSSCGIHHSWEEDLATIPLGNVLYEIQLNVMDDAATIRNFDKGKMSQDGKLRTLHIDDYFAFVDRSPEANDPQTHLRMPTVITQSSAYSHERILSTKYYSMDRLTLTSKDAEFVERIDSFRHVFIRSGSAEITANGTTLFVTSGHSAFIPASCKEFSMQSSSSRSEILISY
ncbi:MAG TPA: hypothetical protein VJB96_01950 [Patescibacteria group bacterium]|nr:hypothetical protein [Patescibacteria group bacterium]